VSPSLCIRGISGNGTFLADLSSRVERTTAALEAFDHATALAETERFFWSGLANNYLELVKGRLREGQDDNDGAASAAATLRLSLRAILRLFAPFMPFVTEKIWSWSAAAHTGFPSIHRAPWPSPTELDAISAPDDPQSFSLALAAIGAVRRYKPHAQRQSVRRWNAWCWPVRRASASNTSITVVRRCWPSMTRSFGGVTT
jgi:valyl-tRNA synthetase